MFYIKKMQKKLIFNQKMLKKPYFFEKIASSIFLLFSFEINIPRIIICSNIAETKLLESELASKCYVEKIKKVNISSFKKIVHYGEFDLGIVFSKSKDIYSLKFLSGSGDELSSVKFSIIENYFLTNEILE